MNDVSALLSQRLQMLEKPFSREWISNFQALMRFLLVQPSVNSIVQSIEQAKTQDHQSLSQNIKRMLVDGKKSIEGLLVHCQHSSALFELVKPKAEALLKTSFDPKRIKDPFFQLESIFYNYYRDFSGIVKDIAAIDTNSFISEYALLSCVKIYDEVHLKHDLIFSVALPKCQQDIEVLLGRRATSIWGKWDLLLQWVEWTKNGISPGNQPFAKNLSNIFRGQNVSSIVQSVGLHFLESLANVKLLPKEQEHPSIKALELFLDEKNQYWIVVQWAGEQSQAQPFFIKKLQQSARSSTLLQKLLDLEPYSLAEFEHLAHTLGELEIKNELKKVFFPHDKFAGTLVHLREIDYAIDSAKIAEHLFALEAAKKNHPPFNWKTYHSR